MTDAKKEQIKLRSNFINGLSLIFFSVGVLAPIVTSIYIKDIAPDRSLLAAATAFVCFSMTMGLHLFATVHLLEIDK
jgi:hypothetical protein